jgi:hypothetical protein
VRVGCAEKIRSAKRKLQRLRARGMIERRCALEYDVKGFSHCGIPVKHVKAMPGSGH